MVEAGRAQRDQPGAAGGQHGEHVGIQAVVDERADHLEAGGQRRGVHVQVGALEDQFEAVAAARKLSSS